MIYTVHLLCDVTGPYSRVTVGIVISMVHISSLEVLRFACARSDAWVCVGGAAAIVAQCTKLTPTRDLRVQCILCIVRFSGVTFSTVTMRAVGPRNAHHKESGGIGLNP